MRRWGVPLGLLLLLSLLLTGCSGGVRQASWPGLVVENGVVYAANVDQVIALEAASGKLLWSFPEKGNAKLGFYSKPVVAQEPHLLLVAGLGDRQLYALQLSDATTTVPGIAWTFAGAKGQYVGSGTIAGELFLIGNGDGNVYALRLTDGTLVWSFKTQDRVWATPVVVDQTVYIASLDHFLYAVNLSDGTERWHQQMNGAISSTPVVVEGSLWVGDFGDTLSQVDLQTGTVQQTFKGKNWFWATPVVSGTTLFVADVGGHVYALDTRNPQSPLWETDVDDVVRGEAVLSPDGQLLLIPGHEKGMIYALDVQTGQLRNWGVKPTNPGRLPGDLASDGERLYAMPIMIQERVQAFDLTDGTLLWNYPVPEQK